MPKTDHDVPPGFRRTSEFLQYAREGNPPPIPDSAAQAIKLALAPIVTKIVADRTKAERPARRKARP